MATSLTSLKGGAHRDGDAEHIITERNPEADSYVLSKVLRCDFEEMEERRKVINYERLLRKAQAKTESNDK